MEQERKASEGRQILVEFADILAHKTLIDARIALIRGDRVVTEDRSTKDLNSVTLMQKYENLFSELSEELDFNNPEDILVESDFNFLLNNCVADFSVNKQEFNDLAHIILKLEELLLVLHNKLNPDVNINHIQNLNLDNIKNISIKLNEFYQTIETTLNKFSGLACGECDKMQETLLEHEDELEEFKQKIGGLMEKVKQLENDKIDLTDKLNNEKNLKKLQENEFHELIGKLKILENMCQEKTVENNEMLQKLSDANEKYATIKQTVENLARNLKQEQDKVLDVEKDYDYLFEQVNVGQDRCKKLERQLEIVELDYADKMEQLHQYYQNQLPGEQTEKERQLEEEKLQQKYQEEIDQLRVSLWFLRFSSIFQNFSFSTDAVGEGIVGHGSVPQKDYFRYGGQTSGRNPKIIV